MSESGQFASDRENTGKAGAFEISESGEIKPIPMKESVKKPDIGSEPINIKPGQEELSQVQKAREQAATVEQPQQEFYNAVEELLGADNGAGTESSQEGSDVEFTEEGIAIPDEVTDSSGEVHSGEQIRQDISTIESAVKSGDLDLAERLLQNIPRAGGLREQVRALKLKRAERELDQAYRNAA